MQALRLSKDEAVTFSAIHKAQRALTMGPFVQKVSLHWTHQLHLEDFKPRPRHMLSNELLAEALSGKDKCPERASVLQVMYRLLSL